MCGFLEITTEAEVLDLRRYGVNDSLKETKAQEMLSHAMFCQHVFTKITTF